MKTGRSAALVFGERVPLRLEERRPQRNRPQRRTADPKHDDIVELPASARGEVGRLTVQSGVSRKHEEAQLVRPSPATETGVGAREGCRRIAPIRGGDPAGYDVGHEVRVVETEGHEGRARG